MIMDKEVYENGNVKFEVYNNDVTSYGIQAGIAGVLLSATELADLYELLHAYIEEFR